jgi:hypothetical protein
MTLKIWRGDAVAVAQITTIQRPAEAGPVSFTIGNKTLRFANWDLAAIVSTWNNTATPPDPVAASEEFSTLLAGSAGDALTLTARTPGIPFFVTVRAGDSDATNRTTDEIQTLTIGNAPTGGTFTLSFNGSTTGNLAYDAAAATLQTALTGLASIGANNCTVTGPAGGPWQIQFTGALAAQNLPAITANRANLTGGTAAVQIETLQDGQTGTNAVQTLSLQSVTAGTFTLSFSGATTAALAWNATAATIQSALEALSTIGTGNITATGGALPAAVTLTFSGTLAAQAVPALTGNGTNLTTTIAATVTETTAGATGPNLRGRVTIPNSSANDSTAWRLRLVYEGQVYLSTTFRRANTAADLLAALQSLAPIGTGNASTTTGGTNADGTRFDDFELIGARAGRHPVTDAIKIGNLTVTYAAGAAAASPRQIILLQYPGGTNERQTLALTGSPTAGTFTLSFGGQTTQPIAYNATAAAVQTALEALSTIETGGITATGGPLPGSNVVIEFRSNGLQSANQPLLTASTTGLNPVIVQTTPGITGTPEIQRLTLTGDPWGGTTTLVIGANTTTALAYNATAATIQTALAALASVGANNVTCSGGPWPLPVVAQFAAALGNLAPATATPTLHNATITITETTPGGALAVVTQTQRSRGPNHWDDPTNWTPAGIPDHADDVTLDGSTDCLYGLRQRATFTANATLNTITIQDNAAPFQPGQKIRLRSTGTLPGGLNASTDYFLTKSALAAADNTFHLASTAAGTPIDITSAGTGTHTAAIGLASLTIPARFTAALGLPLRTDANNLEYRPTALEIDATTVAIGNGPGLGSSRLRLATGTATACTVYTTSGSTETDANAFEWTTAAAGSTYRQFQGDAAISTRGGVASLTTAELHGGTLYLGRTAIIGALTRTAGTLITDQTALTNTLHSQP